MVVAADTTREELIRTMLEHGVQYGRAKRFTHPKVRPFLLRTNRSIEIFDLEITAEQLVALVETIRAYLAEGKRILFVGTQPAVQRPVEDLAVALNQPFMVYKWIGGFLTNFQTIRGRMRFYRDLKDKQASGELDNYPVRDRQGALRELQKMELIYRGVAQLEGLPDVIFSVNLAHKQHQTMAREAKRRSIAVVGVCGADNDPARFTHLVSANDRAPKSVTFLLGYLQQQLVPEVIPAITEAAALPVIPKGLRSEAPAEPTAVSEVMEAPPAVTVSDTAVAEPAQHGFFHDAPNVDAHTIEANDIAGIESTDNE